MDRDFVLNCHIITHLTKGYNFYNDQVLFPEEQLKIALVFSAFAFIKSLIKVEVIENRLEKWQEFQDKEAKASFLSFIKLIKNDPKFEWNPELTKDANLEGYASFAEFEKVLGDELIKKYYVEDSGNLKYPYESLIQHPQHFFKFYYPLDIKNRALSEILNSYQDLNQRLLKSIGLTDVG